MPGQYVNRRAFVFAFLGVLAFYIAAVGLFLIPYAYAAARLGLDRTALSDGAHRLSLRRHHPRLLSAYILRSFHFPFLVTAHDRDPIDEEEDDEYLRRRLGALE